jgi:hypothetical protein
VTADLRERCAEAVRARCQHDAGLTDCEWCVSLAVEALVRAYAAEQLREMVAWIELPDEVGECRRCNHTVKELKSRADALAKEEK